MAALLPSPRPNSNARRFTCPRAECPSPSTTVRIAWGGMGRMPSPDSTPTMATLSERGEPASRAAAKASTTRTRDVTLEISREIDSSEGPLSPLEVSE